MTEFDILGYEGRCGRAELWTIVESKALFNETDLDVIIKDSSQFNNKTKKEDVSESMLSGNKALFDQIKSAEKINKAKIKMYQREKIKFGTLEGV